MGRLLHGRSPRRLPHVPGKNGQALLDASVRGNGREHLAAAGDGGVQDHLTIGCEAGRFVLRRIREDLGLMAGDVHDRHLEAPAVAGDIDQAFAVGRGPGGDVIGAVIGNPLGAATHGGHTINLGATSPVGGEVDVLAIGGVTRFGVDAGRIGQTLHPGAIRIDGEHLGAAVLGKDDGQTSTVRGPGGGGIGTFEIGHYGSPARGQGVYVDDRLLAFKGDVG